MHTHTPNINSLSYNSERKLKFKPRAIPNALKMKINIFCVTKIPFFECFFFADF